MSEIECFHSPALDMDYMVFIFLDMGVIFAGHLLRGRDCEKVRRLRAALKVGWGVLKR